MKKLLFFIIMMTVLTPAYGTTFTGEVSKVGLQDRNRVVDSKTQKGIEFAKVSIPQANFHAYTDKNGNFDLPEIKLKSPKPLMLNVEKEGYRPFSITINNNQSLNAPLKVEIAKSEPIDVSLETGLIHLGDDNFSQNSANASGFKLKSSGPYFSKDFIMSANAKKSTNYLVIGSIAGLDTQLAQRMGQNKIRSTYSTPTEVFFNGQKIGEIKINGDGQQIKIPNSLIIANAKNQITIKTGHNTNSYDHIDYDDIEVMNISILCE